MVPNQYQATVVVTPAKSQSSIGNVASQFGGLASLAGISLSGDEGSEAREAMEIMQSWGFIEEFIENNQLDIQLIAANGWDSDDNRLTYDNSIYDLESNKWVGRPDKGKKAGAYELGAISSISESPGCVLEPRHWYGHRFYRILFSYSCQRMA